MQQRDGTAPPFLMKTHFPFVALSLPPSLSSPQAILTKQFHLSLSTQSVSICTANIKSGRRETDSNVLQSPALHSVNYFLPSGFFCHRANGVQ